MTEELKSLIDRSRDRSIAAALQEGSAAVLVVNAK